MINLLPLNPSNSKMRTALTTFFTILLVDQISKIWIKLNLQLGEEIKIFDWFILHFTENPGMAFGFEFGGDWGKIALTVFRIVFSILGFYYLYKYTQKNNVHKGVLICAGLVLAGAVGNLLDSLFYGLVFTDSLFRVAEFVPPGQGYESFLKGRVVDMLYFPLIDSYWPNWIPFVGGDRLVFFRPVFNIADSSISVGITAFLLFQKRWLPQESDKNTDQKSEPSTEMVSEERLN